MRQTNRATVWGNPMVNGMSLILWGNRKQPYEATMRFTAFKRTQQFSPSKASSAPGKHRWNSLVPNKKKECQRWVAVAIRWAISVVGESAVDELGDGWVRCLQILKFRPVNHRWVISDNLLKVANRLYWAMEMWSWIVKFTLLTTLECESHWNHRTSSKFSIR